jgi:hypothetical protein
MNRAVELGALNWLSYFLLTWDYRVVAQGNYFWAVCTSITLGMLAFSVIKRISEAKGRVEEIGYVIGGTLGTVFGIFTSKLILGA